MTGPVVDNWTKQLVCFMRKRHECNVCDLFAKIYKLVKFSAPPSYLFPTHTACLFLLFNRRWVASCRNKNEPTLLKKKKTVLVVESRTVRLTMDLKSLVADKSVSLSCQDPSTVPPSPVCPLYCYLQLWWFVLWKYPFLKNEMKRDRDTGDISTRITATLPYIT